MHVIKNKNLRESHMFYKFLFALLLSTVTFCANASMMQYTNNSTYYSASLNEITTYHIEYLFDSDDAVTDSYGFSHITGALSSFMVNGVDSLGVITNHSISFLGGFDSFDLATIDSTLSFSSSLLWKNDASGLDIQTPTVLDFSVNPVTTANSAVPLPSALLMFLPALLGFLGFSRKYSLTR